MTNSQQKEIQILKQKIVEAEKIVSDHMMNHKKAIEEQENRRWDVYNAQFVVNELINELSNIEIGDNGNG